VETTDPKPVETGRLATEAAGARLSELFEAHGRMVLGLCRLLLRDIDEAEDAAQQVFLSAHRSMLGGTEPREPAAWLAAIARRECHGRIRSRMATPLELVVEERDAVAADVEQVAGRNAEIEALCAALVELPRQQREAIVLREFYGLSYEEVRVALGVSDGAVESLLFRARKRLQAELQPARVASGVLALPFALRDSIAAAVPGFSVASSGGALSKLASLPLIAKFAGAAATLTVVGTIGFVEVRGPDLPVVAPAVTGELRGGGHASAPKPVRLEGTSFVLAEETRVARGHEGEAEEGDDDSGEPDEAEPENDDENEDEGRDDTEEIAEQIAEETVAGEDDSEGTSSEETGGDSEESSGSDD
jgi:RNA polymerase sigma-70 factor, ECF subfamily